MIAATATTDKDLQTPFDAAVVIPTALRPTLARAVRSVFAQEDVGRLQLLIGVDTEDGDRTQLETLRAECPPHVALTIFDPGYSTSMRHGGIYSNAYGGGLRTILSYAANSRHVAYLDDDDWFGPAHVASLRKAIAGHAWAYSYRFLVDDRTGWVICQDEWDAIGPGRGINAERFGGFVNPSSLMLDKIACHMVLPAWSVAMFPDGSGEDRLVFRQLLKLPHGATGTATSYFQMTARNIDDAHHGREFQARGILWPQQRDLIDEVRRHAAKAQTLSARGETDCAMAACRMALAINPHHAESLALMGKIEKS